MHHSLYGNVLAIATRSVHRGPMIKTDQADAYCDDCLKGDHGFTTRRGLTLMAAGQWEIVMKQLGVDLPWHTCRANVLIDADTLEPLIGKTIQIGPVKVWIHA